MSRIEKSKETESKLVVAGAGKRSWGRDLLVDTGLFCGEQRVDGILCIEIVVRVAQFCEDVNTHWLFFNIVSYTVYELYLCI